MWTRWKKRSCESQGPGTKQGEVGTGVLQLYMRHVHMRRGVQEDGYPHMKEVAEKEYHPVNFADLDKKVDAHVPQG